MAKTYPPFEKYTYAREQGLFEIFTSLSSDKSRIERIESAILKFSKYLHPGGLPTDAREHYDAAQSALDEALSTDNEIVRRRSSDNASEHLAGLCFSYVWAD